ncbi:hypothetical protein RND81_11G135100 [Saponaria officinalis]|uniref:Uncharacterized protein n=1 Tax=Saponaria officinalis TaxID=3572 RepID=A0AAW1HLL9_SAPOF
MHTIWEIRNKLTYDFSLRTPPAPMWFTAMINTCNETVAIAVKKEEITNKRIDNEIRTIERDWDPDTAYETHRARSGLSSFLIGKEGSCSMLQIKVNTAWKRDQGVAIGWAVYLAGN